MAEGRAPVRREKLQRMIEAQDRSLRIFLAGRVTIEVDGRLLDEGLLLGGQGRLAFAYLVCQRHRPVHREELADVIWPQSLPPSWEGSVKAIVSKLRRVLDKAALDGANAIQGAFGCYQLILPDDTWVDVVAAAEIQHECDACIRRGEFDAAFGWQGAASAITRRPFLPGEEGPWVESMRNQLVGIRLRSLEAGGMLHLHIGEPEVAVRLSEEAIELEPFRESAYRLLMRARVAEGNRAEALRVYERCRALLEEHLGADPAPETQQLHGELLRFGLIG